MHRAGLILLFSCGEALAHPGHASVPAWLHLVTEPDHLAALLLPLAIGLVWALRRGTQRGKPGSGPGLPGEKP